MTDVFNANKLVRDAGEVTNSYVYIKSWIGTYGYMYRDIQNNAPLCIWRWYW